MNELRSHTGTKCKHDVFDPKNTLVVESNPFSGSRIRCKKCGACSWIKKRGRIEPQTCECHGLKAPLSDDLQVRK